jgi:hypothetical protein
MAGDRVAVADDHPVDAAHLAALAWMPSRRAAPTSASAASGPGQVISSARAARLGQRAVGEERPAPRGLGVARTADHLGRQPADRTAALVDQAGLSSQVSPSSTTRTTYRLPLRSPPAGHDHDLGAWP